MERSKNHYGHVQSLHQKLGVHEHLLESASDHVESRDQVLSLSFATVFFGLCKHPRHEGAVFILQKTLRFQLLVNLLLLYARFELVFVLQSLSLHLFLLRDRVFIRLSSLLSHHLFLLQLLLVALQLQLHLVFCLTLLHFGLELQGFTLLLVFDLGTLNFKLFLRLFKLKLLGLLLLESDVEGRLRVLRAI